MVEMEVDSLRTSIGTHAKILILKERNKKEDRFLPIWISDDVAESISVKLQGVNVPRPLTHDFILDLILTVGLQVDKAVINKVENNIHYAKLVLTSHEDNYEIDCRPSDAVAIAIRALAPIFVEEEVLSKVATTDGVMGEFQYESRL